MKQKRGWTPYGAIGRPPGSLGRTRVCRIIRNEWQTCTCAQGWVRTAQGLLEGPVSCIFIYIFLLLLLLAFMPGVTTSGPMAAGSSFTRRKVAGKWRRPFTEDKKKELFLYSPAGLHSIVRTEAKGQLYVYYSLTVSPWIVRIMFLFPAFLPASCLCLLCRLPCLHFLSISCLSFLCRAPSAS